MGSETPTIASNERITLRIRDASIVSGLSRSTLYELLKAGKIRAVKVGGRRLILRESRWRPCCSGATSERSGDCNGASGVAAWSQGLASPGQDPSLLHDR